LVKIPTALSGLFMVPLLYRYRNTHYEFLPWWTRPWSNPEDWHGPGNGNNSLPLWWIKTHGNTFKEFYRYHAIRNPANGLRSFELLDLDIYPPAVKFRRSKNYRSGVGKYEPMAVRAWGVKRVWYLAWQGYRAGFKYIRIWNDERHMVIKIGWRVEPSDATTKRVNIGTEDASFASKILLYRKG